LPFVACRLEPTYVYVYETTNAAETTSHGGGTGGSATTTVAPDTTTGADTTTRTAETTTAETTTAADTTTLAEGTTTADTTTHAPDTGPRECSPALGLSVDVPSALALDVRRFKATGGTGRYRFRFAANGSGGLLHPLSGAYLAGEKTGVVDLVGVTDDGCLGEATSAVRVVLPAVVSPAAVQVAPGTRFAFETTLGSGRMTFALGAAPSGATLTASGLYTAGPTDAQDLVTVRDLETATVTTVIVTVKAGTRLAATPPFVAVPVGAGYVPLTSGGSGRLDAGALPDGATWDGTSLSFFDRARAAVAVTDHFSGQSTTLDAQGLAALPTTTYRYGDGGGATVAGAGDVNGDGYADAVIGVPEVDVGGLNSGAVMLYLGSADGLSVTPARVFTASKNDGLGNALAVADFDRDGRPDLAIGIMNSDVGSGDCGRVLVYRGTGAGYEASAAWTFDGCSQGTGRAGGDNFGSALASGDFDGDGYADLAVGARGVEDRTGDGGYVGARADRGGVFIYRGSFAGLPTQPDQVLYGSYPDGNGGLGVFATLWLGESLAAGDFDGDGADDLAAGGFSQKLPGSTSSADGFVQLFAGRRASQTPLSTFPVRVIAGPSNTAAVTVSDPSSRFGLALAMRDLDGDGKAELAVGQPYHDVTGVNDVGAVRLFRGKALPASPAAAVESANDADWTAEGGSSSERMGGTVDVGDVTGDGTADLLTGSILGGPGGGGYGTVFIGLKPFGGRFALPSKTQLVFGSGNAGDRSGAVMAVVGDTDGGGRGDVVAWAPFSDAWGLDVGSPIVFPMEGRPGEPLSFPGGPSASQVGRSVAAVGDIDGDGYEDVLVGAPQADVPQVWPNYLKDAGFAWLLRGRSDGYDPTAVALAPLPAYAGSSRQRASDNFGWAVSGIGDFDGDGAKDFAVLARNADRLKVLAGDDGGACATNNGDRNDTGAVWIFRGTRGDTFNPQPAFVFHGPEAGNVIEAITGGVDLNGDGKSEVVVSSTKWKGAGSNSYGGLVVLKGRAADPQGRLVALCDISTTDAAAREFELLGPGGSFGSALAPLPDLDGDGCDEVAVSATSEDVPGKSQAGTVRVLFGWGGARCPAQPRFATFSPAIASQKAGAVLAAGDVDADGLADLAVGVPGASVVGSTTGAVYLLRGAWLKTAARDGASTFVEGGTTFTRLGAATTVTPTAASGDAVAAPLTGGVPNDGFATGLAVIPAGVRGPTGFVVASRPSATFSGVASVGFIGLHPYLAPLGTFDTAPAGLVGGETFHPAGAQFGSALSFGRRGTAPILVVGAYEASSRNAEDGAAFVVDLSP
jgi:hypothetical protein